jgi:hypothetical protein
MTQKMKEMDDVIRRVHAASLQVNLERTLLVCDYFLFLRIIFCLVTYLIFDRVCSNIYGLLL